MGANFRPDIEGLRGLAVLLVVVFHAGLALPGGFIGVDVFFVISGFLITGLLLREREQTGRIDLAAFYARRVRRLLPAAVVVLLVTLPIAYALFAPLDRGEMLLDGAAAALSVGNMRFALAEGDYFASIATPSPFLHFWSLGVEEQFYLVWPALLLVAARVRRIRVGVGAALFDVFLASLLAGLILIEFAPNWAFYSLPTRAFELAAGGMLAVGAPLVARLPAVVLGPAGWIGLAAVVWSAFAFDAGMAFPGLAALIPTVGTVALIAAGLGSPAGRRASGWLSPAPAMSVAPVRFVGRISYSLYLVHWPVFVLAGLYFGFGAQPDPASAALLIAVSIGLATLSWAFVEEPFRRGLSPRLRLRLPRAALRPRTTLATGLAAMLSVVLLANGLVMAAQRDLAQIGQGQPIGWAGPEWSGADNDPDVTGPDGVEPGEDYPEEPAEELPEVFIPDEEPTPAPAPTSTPTQRAAESTDDPGRLPTPAPTPKPTARPTPKPTPKPKPRPTPSDWALPADVQPAVTDARSDKEKPWFDRCLGIESSVKPRAACTYGDPNGSYTIALVGDSHGSAMFPAFDWVAKKNGWRLLVYVKVACPFMDIPVRSLVLKREYTECAQWNADIISRLNAAPPNLVVIHMSHWIFPVQSGLGASDYARSMARMIDRLSSRTVILADTPHSAMDVPACLSANWWDIRACSTPRWDAMSGHGVIEKRAAEAARVALIDLANEICVMKPCPAVVDKMIVYRDKHHLTATYARSLGPALNRLLELVR